MSCNELLLDLDDELKDIEENQNKENTYPGTYLGLDISKESTGICIYKNGVRETYNAKLNNYRDSPHYEVLMRRELSKDILEACGTTTHFDAIIIEDVFNGENPQTVRLLYALNTAIDELILDGRLSCSKFVRVPNTTWKSWLWSVDTFGEFKGLNDKLKIEKCLMKLGIEELGNGFQDRLDATGMIYGYILVGNSIENKKKRVSFSDLLFSYEEDIDLIKMNILSSSEDVKFMYIPCKRVTKKWVLDIISENPEVVIITENPVKLGSFGTLLDFPLLDEGYLGFWVKDSARKKYLGG